MKRMIAMLLVLCSLLALAACKDSSDPAASTGSATSPGSESVSTAPTAESTEATVGETEPTTGVTEPSANVTEPTPSETATKPQETEVPTVKPSSPTVETEPGKWVEQEGKTYYHIDGKPHTGWLELGEDRYYFHTDGTMARGKTLISQNETRYFTSTGKEIILVNPWNFIPDDYTVELTKIGGYKVATQAADALKQMLKDCKKAGCPATLSSGYRTHGDQVYLFQRRIDRFIAQGYDKETARIEAAKRVAVPGTSEHELGLAVDIVDADYKTLNSKQEDTPAQKWLMEHCWEYGFILRYPSEKTEITGIIYEPWHYRYVGKELAAELHENGLCLEEYLDSLTNNDINESENSK